MGTQSSQPLRPPPATTKNRQIQEIYSMFREGNKVILSDLKNQGAPMSQSRIKNIDVVLQQLLSPFLQCQRYTWGQQIHQQFKRNFSYHFTQVWQANRQQFYQFLLINCNCDMKQVRENPVFKSSNYQTYLYEVAITKIEESIPDNLDMEKLDLQKKMDVFNASILDQEFAKSNSSEQQFPLMVPFSPQNSRVDPQQQSTQINNQNSKHPEGYIQSQTYKNKPQKHLLGVQNRQLLSAQHIKRLRVEKSSVLMPQTVFPQRVNAQVQQEVADMLKYYAQFTNTLQQIFYSNNLISCPFKHFVFCLQDKIHRKKIRGSAMLPESYLSQSEQVRKVRSQRQMNNNYVLFEVKCFLQAYTQFVWMYLQLHLMAESRMGKIITSEILYGVIFKCVWGIVDWVADRGYQLQQTKLYQYFLNKQPNNKQSEYSLNNQPSIKISTNINQYYDLLQMLRNQKQPQQFLKKVVIFYREVSKSCQNADQLLTLYEQVLGGWLRERGDRGVHLFRMRNIIEKLLRIQEGSLSGGQISYSWTTWCIVLELLREKVNYKYGSLLIKSTSKLQPLKSVDKESQQVSSHHKSQLK